MAMEIQKYVSLERGITRVCDLTPELQPETTVHVPLLISPISLQQFGLKWPNSTEFGT